MDRPALADTARSLRRVRWAQALVYGAIGFALLATAFQSWLDVQRVRTEVTAAQGRRLLFAVGRELEDERPPTREGLERVLQRHQDEGLRCVAIMRHASEAPLATPDCLRTPATLQEQFAAARPGTMIDVDGFVAVASDPPPPHDRPPPPPGAPPLGADVHGGPPPGAPPPWMGPRGPGDRPDEPPRGPPPLRGPGGAPPHERVLLVYEPLEANALRQSAARSLGVALVTVIALAIATIVLWRLARRAEHLQAAAERDRRLVTLGQMSAVLAHEIRNPLAALKGHAQLLVERLDERPDRRGPEREKAERLVSEARRLERLVEDLLSFVRANRVTPAPADPVALLRDAASAVAADRVDVDVAGAPSTWRLDAPRLQQALANLIRNALEASPDGARIGATVTRDGERLVFAIRDRGAGLPPGDPEHLFEPFHTTRVQGTGLGLAVARRIVELHGGRVTARTRPDGGAEFRVMIP
jgi:two-component system, NtrC family, sensor histidine kinase HydH